MLSEDCFLNHPVDIYIRDLKLYSKGWFKTPTENYHFLFDSIGFFHKGQSKSISILWNELSISPLCYFLFSAQQCHHPTKI